MSGAGTISRHSLPVLLRQPADKRIDLRSLAMQQHRDTPRCQCAVAPPEFLSPNKMPGGCFTQPDIIPAIGEGDNGSAVCGTVPVH